MARRHDDVSHSRIDNRIMPRASSSTYLPSTMGDGEHDNTDDVPTVTGVTLKMAFDSSDSWGVADLSETRSERFTSSESLDMVHRLRSASDAILVGRGTVMRDDCTLTVRRGVVLGYGKDQPVRVVIDPSLTLLGDGGDERYAILNDGLSTIVYHRRRTAGGESRETKSPRSDRVTLVEIMRRDDNDNDIEARSSYISPSDILDDLSSRGLRHVMVEGGPSTACAFLAERVVDRAIFVRAPILFDLPVPAGMDINSLAEAGLVLIGTTMSGGDVVEYWTMNGMPWPTPDLHMWP